MKQIFSYNKFNEDVADGLVETCYSLAQKSIEGKNNTPEYVEANKTFNEEFMKYCVENAGMKWSGLDMIKNPMVYKKSGFLETFDTILAGAITPVPGGVGPMTIVSLLQNTLQAYELKV